MAYELTKRILAERYLIKFSGGMMSDDSRLDERFFIQEINQALATVAKDSFLENSNYESISFANDQFITKSAPIQILTETDGSGMVYSNLLDIPVGLPKGRGLVSVMPVAGLENTLKPISVREVPLLINQPQIPKRTFYWIEGSKIFYYPKPSFTKVITRTISSGSSDIDTPLTVPEEVLVKVEAIVKQSVAMVFQIPNDTISDGQPINNNGR